MKTYTYHDGLGAEIVRMTMDQAITCSHQGQCIDDVEGTVNDVTWLADDATLRAMLKEFGAWDDLDTASQHELRCRALWIAAGDIQESEELYEDAS